jgi:hypothetical protein
MEIGTFTRRLALLAVIIGSLGMATPANADSADLDHARTVLADTAKELTLVREHIANLEEILEDGRVYLAPVPVLGVPEFSMVTRELAIKYWTFQYILTRQTSGRSFSASQLEEVVREMMKNGRIITNDIEETIRLLEERERQLAKRRGDLEQQVADMQGPQRTGRCADLQRVDRTHPLGLGAYVNRGALEHYVNQSGDTGRGWIGNFTLTWTAPPDRICVGETFPVTLTATNNSPVQDTLGRAAQVGMVFKPAALTATCDNRPPFDPNSAAFVGANESAYTNTCTVTVNFVGDGTQPVDLIHMSLTAIPAIVTLTYIYQ